MCYSNQHAPCCWYRFPSFDTWQASQSTDTLLCPQGSLSPKRAAAQLPPKQALVRRTSACPVPFCGEAPCNTSCCAEAELSTSPSLSARRVSYGQRTMLVIYTTVQNKQHALAQLRLQISHGRGRKDCFCRLDATWLRGLCPHFDLLSHSHFFRVL